MSQIDGKKRKKKKKKLRVEIMKLHLQILFRFKVVYSIHKNLYPSLFAEIIIRLKTGRKKTDVAEKVVYFS